MRVPAPKTALTTAIGAVALATTLVGGTGPATAAGNDVQVARGDVRSADAFHLVYNGKVAKGQPDTKATGFFAGQAKLGNTELISFSGPITCLHVSGNSVGFFYPITKSSPDAVAALGAGVYIYVDSDGKGNATAFTFLPSPAATSDGCAPAPGTAPATGFAVAYAGPDTTQTGPAQVYPVLGKPVTLTGTAKPGAVVRLLMRSTGETAYVLRRVATANAAGVWASAFVPTRDTNVIAASGPAFSVYSTTRAVIPAPNVSGPGVRTVKKGSTQVLAGHGVPGSIVHISARPTAGAPGVYPIQGVVRVAANGTWSRAFVATKSYDFYVSRTSGAKVVALYRYKAV